MNYIAAWVGAEGPTESLLALLAVMGSLALAGVGVAAWKERRRPPTSTTRQQATKL